MISTLYRAKTEDTHSWVCGTPIFNGYLVEIMSDTTHKKYIIDKDTICKCLDILDRDNQEIFEGDVVQVTQRGPKKAIVEWDKECLCWRLNFNINGNLEKNITKYKPLIQASKAHLFKVIGNMFDNKEYYAL